MSHDPGSGPPPDPVRHRSLDSSVGTPAATARFVLVTAIVTLAVTYFFTLTLGDTQVAGGAYRTPRWAVIVHLATVLPAMILGAAMLVLRKGGRRHRQLGWIWVALMATTAVASFWLRSSSGRLSAIHLFSIATLLALPISIWRIRARDAVTHRHIQLSLYVGLLVAGAFALAPDREIGRMLLVFG